MVKAVVTLIYGILIAFGGVMGYVMAGSPESLIAGGGLGLLAIIGAVLLFMGNSLGQTIAAVAASLVGLFFLYQLGLNFGKEDPNFGRPIGVIVLTVIELAVLFLIKSPSTPETVDTPST